MNGLMVFSRILVLFLIGLSSQLQAANYTQTFSWNEGSNWYPVQWVVHDSGTPATWQASTAYSTGATVVGTTPVYGVYYECTRAGTSDATEPTWPTVDGSLVDDPDGSGVQWTAVHNNAYYQWFKNSIYTIGDRVFASTDPAYGWYYECIRGGLSGETEPTWTNTEGATITGTLPDRPVVVRIFANDTEIGQAYDNESEATRTEYTATWNLSPGRVHITSSAELAAGEKWTASTAYTTGDLVVATTLFGNGWVYFECTRDGTSGATEPTWSTVDGATIDDPDAAGVQWTVHNTAIGQWQPGHAYNLNDRIRPSTIKTPGGTVYKCTRAGTSGATEPNWQAGGKIPWFAFFRKWWQTFGIHVATHIEDPDNNGCQWVMEQRPKISDPSAQVRLNLKTANEAADHIGRSMN